MRPNAKAAQNANNRTKQKLIGLVRKAKEEPKEEMKAAGEEVVFEQPGCWVRKVVQRPSADPLHGILVLEYVKQLQEPKRMMKRLSATVITRW